MSQEQFPQGEFEKINEYEILIEKVRGRLEELMLAKEGRAAPDAIKREASEIAAEIYDKALEMDEIIKELLHDPRISELYDYDGRNFSSKSGEYFSPAMSGKRLLETLISGETIEACFLVNKDNESATKDALRIVGNRLKEDQTVLFNWRKYGIVSIAGPETIGEELDRRDRTVTPMSEEEKRFFESYEKELTQEKDDGK